MIGWRRWWWGLIPLFLIFLLALRWAPQPISSDLSTRAKTALEAAGHDWAAVNFDGRDATLRGAAPSPEHQSAARLLVEKLRGVRTIADTATLLPEQKPYRLSFKKDPNGITLTGYAPDTQAKKYIASLVAQKFPGISVREDIKLARGAGEREAWLSHVSFMVEQATKMVSAEARLEDGKLSLIGGAKDMASYQSLSDELMSLPRGLSLALNDTWPAEVKPYLLSIKKTDQNISISGYAPDEATISQLNTVLSALGSVEGKARKAGGLAKEVSFSTLIDTSVVFLKGVKSGRVDLRDTTLTLEGEALDLATLKMLQEMAARAPQGLKVAIELTAPAVSPYRTSVRRDASGVTLTGYYPDEKTRSALLEEIKNRFSGEKVTDQLELASGAPSGLLNAIRAGLEQLPRLASGSMSVRDNVISIVGDAYFDAAVVEISQAINGATPAGYQSVVSIRVQPELPALSPEMCQKTLSEILARSRIYFETGSAAISQRSAGVLDALTATAQRCKGTKIEVEGHTDDVGAPDANLVLSYRRAMSVVDYLVRAGVDTMRLTAVGYGAQRPLEQGESEEARARNRRIEFLIK